MSKQNEPTRNTIRVMRVSDLSPDRSLRTYEIKNADGTVHVVNLEKRKRQIIDLLMRGPVYCASPVRISDVVFILKKEIGLDVETIMYPGDPATGAGDYGVYYLRSKVRRLTKTEVAA